MIPARENQLRRAFRDHRKVAEKISGTSSYLLLFYAAECGLKSIYLRDNNLTDTNRIPELLSKYGHDLNQWVKLNTELNEITSAPHFHLAKNGRNCNISEVHQLWRYGITIRRKDEEDLVEWLKNLCNSINKNIKQGEN